jgi:hypothetical protein
VKRSAERELLTLGEDAPTPMDAPVWPDIITGIEDPGPMPAWDAGAMPAGEATTDGDWECEEWLEVWREGTEGWAWRCGES